MLHVCGAIIDLALIAALPALVEAPFASMSVGIAAAESSVEDASVEEAGASLRDYAQDFNDVSIEVRESASRQLIDDAHLSTDDIIDFLNANWATLAPESAERFMLAAQERFTRNPGAIGIEFAHLPVATIERIVPGAPAEKVLRVRDQFIALNGEPLPESNEAQPVELLRRMAVCKAGDMVKARIRRGNQELDVEFALADPRALPGFDTFIDRMSSEMLRQWIEIRESRLPPVRPMLIDMKMDDQASDVAALPASSSDDAELIESLRHRRAEISQRIAEVVEQSSAADSPQRRLQLQRMRLPLSDELARLNARLRLLDRQSADLRRR